MPTRDAIDRTGLGLSDEAMDELLSVKENEWVEAVARQKEFFSRFGDRLPAGIREEHEGLAKRVGAH